MMPHPERCAESMLGNEDGRLILASMVEGLKNTKRIEAVVCDRSVVSHSN
jgi:phosphoribosylformylglycinamidine synthase